MPTPRSAGPKADKSERKDPRPTSKGKPPAAPSRPASSAAAKVPADRPATKSGGERRGKTWKRPGRTSRPTGANGRTHGPATEEILERASKFTRPGFDPKAEKGTKRAPAALAKEPRDAKKNAPAALAKEPRDAKKGPPAALAKEPRDAKKNASSALAKEPRDAKKNAPAAAATKADKKAPAARARGPVASPAVDENNENDDAKNDKMAVGETRRTPTRRRAITVVTEGPFKAGTVAIIGRPNVGKSTLVNASLGEQLTIVSSRPQTTRDTILGVRTLGQRQLAVLDTPGLHKASSKLGAHMNAAVTDAVERADIVLFVTEPPARGHAVRPADRAILSRLRPGAKVVLGLNKVDTVVPKERLLPMLEALSEVREFVSIVPFSARDEDNVERLFAVLAELLPEGEALYDDDTLTDRPLRFFAAEYVREQLLRKIRDEIPHGVGVVVDSWEPRETLDYVELTVLVARESHKPIVLGARGEMLQSIGTEARARLEKLTGRQAMIKIFVRVEPDWFERPDRLRELGYAAESTIDRLLVEPS